MIDAMVISTQLRDKLGNRRSQDNEMPTTVWKEYKAKERKGSKERKESSDSRRGKDCKIGDKWQKGLGKRRGDWSGP